MSNSSDQPASSGPSCDEEHGNELSGTNGNLQIDDVEAAFMNGGCMIDAETALQIAEAKCSQPGMFVSGWDNDEDTNDIYEKDMMEVSEQVLTAAEEGNLSELESLLTDNPDLVNARDLDEYTPLHRACYNDHPEVAHRLLERGADPTACTAEGWTPLHCAAHWGCYRTMQVLLQSGRVNVNARTHGQLTPLHFAVSCNANIEHSLHTVKLLLQQTGIELHPVSGGGETPKQIAYRTHKNIYDLFERL